MRIDITKQLLYALMASAMIYACANEAAMPEGEPAADFAAAKADYEANCASCHGAQMQAFVDRRWKYPTTPDTLFHVIKTGLFEDTTAHSFAGQLSDEAIHEMVAYIQTGIAKVEEYDFEGIAPPSGTVSTEAATVRIDTVARDLSIPWGMTFLPNGDLLFTERGGQLYRLTADGAKQEISGTPEVLAQGQGGLLDVELHPQFAENGLVYLSYSKFKKEGEKTLSTTAIARGKLVGNRLEGAEDIFVALPYATTRHHYGSRLEFDPEGYLYFSVGDRGNRDENPQNLDNHCGKIHRIHDDGSIPEDNPFVDQEGALPSIYSYGHRNPQGLAMQPGTGVMWDHEHGPRGGDEINMIEKGKNYGWPIISYGINYNGTTFTTDLEKAGMEQPDLYWVPSIAPCGSTFVSGDLFPGWKGNLLVGSLRYHYINRCIMENGEIVGEEKLLENIGRVRAVEESPDGHIYIAVEGPGFIFRLSPVES